MISHSLIFGHFKIVIKNNIYSKLILFQHSTTISDKNCKIRKNSCSFTARREDFEGFGQSFLGFIVHLYLYDFGPLDSTPLFKRPTVLVFLINLNKFRKQKSNFLKMENPIESNFFGNPSRM